MVKPAKVVVHNPKSIIAATLALTVICLLILITRGISFNGSPETLARKDETYRFYNETRSVFGDDRIIIVAITTSDVFTRQFLERLNRLTLKLAAIPGVDQAMSLTNIKAIRREADSISVGRLIDPYRINQASDQELAALRQEITKDPLYVRHYVSQDGRTTSVDVFLKTLDEAETRAVADQIEREAKSEANGDEIILTGVPVVDARGIRSMLRDTIVLSPIAALLCFGVFLIAFRTFWGAMLPMCALFIGLIWTVGLMSGLGRPITLATLSLPTTLMAVGSSYIFHVLNQYRVSMSALALHHDERDEQRAWLEGLRFIIPAVVLSATATMAGFGALASSTVPTARDMGIFEALGVLALLFLTVCFIPAALSLLPRHALGTSDQRRDYAMSLNGLLVNITALVLFRRRSVLFVTLLATFIIGAGVFWLRVDTNYLHIFPRGSETVRDAEKLHERLAGAATVQLVVSGSKGSIGDPEFLRAAAKLEAFALQQPGVDAGISVVDIIKRIDQVLRGSPPDADAGVPDDAKRLSMILNDYLFQDPSFTRLVTADGSRMTIVLRVNLFSSTELKKLTQNVEAWSVSNLPPGISQKATGSIILLNDASDAVATSQATSLGIALVTIYLMMVALFRSLSTGLLALIPNLLPIVCYFGCLGWSGTPLDITSSLVASAVLGLAVDNAVHMIRRYRQSVALRREQCERGDEKLSASDGGWAMWLTMLRTGKPMVLANLMLIAAFLVFVLSSFVPVRVAGILWATGIASCLAADLVFLPVLMKSKLFERAALGDAIAGKSLNPSSGEVK
jgi:uncharacterized protein